MPGKQPTTSSDPAAPRYPVHVPSARPAASKMWAKAPMNAVMGRVMPDLTPAEVEFAFSMPADSRTLNVFTEFREMHHNGRSYTNNQFIADFIAWGKLPDIVTAPVDPLESSNAPSTTTQK